jgi:2-oxoglutarate dehydrogenase E2 component (dihydrolipoamide succinyltransferase)
MAIDILVPEMGESVLEATVTDWKKKVGDYINIGDILLELETQKVNLEVGAKDSGILAKINFPAGADVKLGDVLGVIDESGQPAAPSAAPAKEAKAAPASSEEAAAPTRERIPPATPVAMRVAKENGVDVGALTGTGPEGRVTRLDVEQFVQGQQQARDTSVQAPGKPVAPAATPAPTPAPKTQAETSLREKRIRMSRRRRTIAQRLLEVQQTTAMLTTFNEIDMSVVMDLRKRRNDDFAARNGVKIGFSSFFVKAVIGALKAFPQLNAEIDGDEMVLKSYYDIGMALGAEEGLVVPVLRDADRLSFAGIEKQIKDFVAKSNSGKLSIEDLRGGTFTITNGGVYGSLLSTPILNPPQVGILGLHNIQERPVARNGEIVLRPMMYVALSYDHRIVDGREAVQFLVKIKELIEDPEKLLLEG